MKKELTTGTFLERFKKEIRVIIYCTTAILAMVFVNYIGKTGIKTDPEKLFWMVVAMYMVVVVFRVIFWSFKK